MLVSGREDTTEKSLQSLELLKKELDTEIIVVDTGCKKPLLEKIEQYVDKIIPFTWCNDFAKARNVGLEAAQGKWFLYLDDDEWFDDVTPIIDFFKSGEYQDYHQAAYIARNYKNMEGTEYSNTWVSRMIRIEEDTHFEGRVHESLVPARGKCKKINAFVHHYGYVYTNEEERKKHVERNIAILEPLIIEEPNNLRWRLQMIQEYVSMQMWDKLRKNGEDGIKIAETSEKPFHNLCRGSFYAAILLADIHEKKWDALWEDYSVFIADKRNPWSVRCTLAAMMASGLAEIWQTGNVNNLVELLDKRNQEDEAPETIIWKIITDCIQEYFSCFKQYESEEKEEQWQLIEESAVLVAEDTTKPMQLKMCYLWAEGLAKILCDNQEVLNEKQKEEWLKQQLNCFTKWQSLLISDMEQKLEQNGEFLNIAESIWNMAQAGLLPLEELLLSLPMSQWMAQMMVLESKGYGLYWETISQHLGEICSTDDIRYAFFDMKTEIAKMKQVYAQKENVQKMDYQTITQVLYDFTFANLHYAEFVYTDAAFEGEMEFLPEEIRSVFWLSKALGCEETDWSKRLQYIKKAAKEWSLLGEIVKQYAVLIGEERDKVQTASQNAQNELLQMANSMKTQIFAMVEKGMLQEAFSVVKQLRGMLPEDAELIEMENILVETINN